MDHPTSTAPDADSLPQGDPRLLGTPLAQRLLRSTIPARVAYLARDGTPRVVSTWFHWTGMQLTMATFLAAPHVAGPARRLRALRERPEIAVTIDTEPFPPEVLLLRGAVSIEDLDGVAPEYATAAARYLGAVAAAQYVAQIDRPGTRMARITLRPSWVGLLDFESRSPGALT